MTTHQGIAALDKELHALSQWGTTAMKARQPHPEDVEGNLKAARTAEVLRIVERVIDLHGRMLDTGEGDVIDLVDVLDRWSEKQSVDSVHQAMYGNAGSQA